jgi:hypothetical protein
MPGGARVPLTPENDRKNDHHGEEERCYGKRASCQSGGLTPGQDAPMSGDVPSLFHVVVVPRSGHSDSSAAFRARGPARS